MSIISNPPAPDIADEEEVLVSERIVQRLCTEFAGRYSMNDIVRVIEACREQLDCSPAAALPELTERLARQRLATRTSVRTDNYLPALRTAII